MNTKERILALLKGMSELKASDMHLRPGSKPILRINGDLKPVNQPELTPEDTDNIAAELCSEEQFNEFKKRYEVDLAYNLEGTARFRINVFKQRGVTNLALRLIPSVVKSIDELDLPESLKKISLSSRGLVLVTGTTGSGKSTTLAAMIDYINKNASKHIITVEDPIEYIHKDNKSIVAQRELGIDTFSYNDALRNIVRQDPDVIFIGEMRDMETMSAALTSAQTGHLVLSTIHTIDAMQTVTRIVDIYPPFQQNQIRLQLADSLCAVISQRLLPKKNGEGMIPAVEVLVATSLIRNLIEENDFSSISEQLEKGDYYGMQTFNQALEKLCRAEKVDIEDAKRAATNPEDLLLRLRGIKSGSGTT
ncbi:MAG: type IV pilus twitching motility protein PilT [Elusimicrobiota bacterium]